MATQDFEAEAKKVAEEARRQSAEAQAASGQPVSQMVKEDEVDQLKVKEQRDGAKAVDPATGRASSEDVPRDSNAEQPQPDNGNTPRQPGNAPVQPGAEPPRQPAAPVTPAQSEAFRASADRFKGKAKSFFAADVDKGFWDTLEAKIKEATAGGNSPEDVAQAATFAALTCLFDLIGNWADHHRKDKKRLAKEYEDNVKAYDTDIGVKAYHKDLAVWAAIADHPDLKIYQDKPITKEVRQAVAKVLQKDKAAILAMKNILESATHREWTMDEVDKNARIALGKTTLMELNNISLNDPVIGEAVNNAPFAKAYKALHQRAEEHHTRVEENARNRTILNNARSSDGRTPDPRMRPDRGRDAA